MHSLDRATLRDWAYAASHMALIVVVLAFVGTACYIAILNARDKTPLCAPDTTPAKVKP